MSRVVRAFHRIEQSDQLRKNQNNGGQQSNEMYAVEIISLHLLRKWTTVGRYPSGRIYKFAQRVRLEQRSSASVHRSSSVDERLFDSERDQSCCSFTFGRYRLSYVLIPHRTTSGLARENLIKRITQVFDSLLPEGGLDEVEGIRVNNSGVIIIVCMVCSSSFIL